MQLLTLRTKNGESVALAEKECLKSLYRIKPLHSWKILLFFRVYEFMSGDESDETHAHNGIRRTREPHFSSMRYCLCEWKIRGPNEAEHLKC